MKQSKRVTKRASETNQIKLKFAFKLKGAAPNENEQNERKSKYCSSSTSHPDDSRGGKGTGKAMTAKDRR